MNTDLALRDVGKSLVEYSKDIAEFTAQRRLGLIDELFPYIYRASKRMSTRAISRWLKESHGVKLSAVTIAKSLRESDRHWLSLFEEVEPAANIVARAHDYPSGRALLEDHQAIFHVIHDTPSVSGESGMNEYCKAQNLVEALWLKVLDEAGREDCLAAVAAAERKESEKEDNGDADDGR
jgi:hypothetical protein